MKYIGWNIESGFVEVDEKDEDNAKLRIELNQDAIFLGTKEDIEANMLEQLGLLKPSHYLLFVWGDVQPELFGPFNSKEKRDSFALEKRIEEGDTHGYYQLAVENGKPMINFYSGVFFEDVDDYIFGRCTVCHDKVPINCWREHLEGHNPNADKFDWDQVEDCFEKIEEED